MKTVKKCAAQGEILLTKVEGIPQGAKEHTGDGDDHIVGHSETGHHHVVNRSEARFYGTEDPFVCYLHVTAEYADLVHRREFDTHETIRIPRGVWRVNRQQEYTPEGWRAVQD